MPDNMVLNPHLQSSNPMKMATSPRTTIPVLLFGCGGVGQQLLLSILTTRKQYAAKGLHLAVVGVVDSRTAALGNLVPELEDEALRHVVSLKASQRPLASGDAQALSLRFESSDRIFQEVENFALTCGLVVVDCTASDKMCKVLAEAAKFGCGIVIANKKPITSTLELYDKLLSAHRRFRCESTVGAGLPVIAALTRVVAAGDPVHRVVGALSGTLGYVMSGLQEGRPLSDVVQSAKVLGYTEPDPREDLSGMDVARKALILARCMGWRITMAEVQVESMYPEQLGPDKLSTTEFLETGIRSLDSAMQSRVQAAASKGFVLRYVATVENRRCKAGLVEVPKDSPLGRLSGSNNLIEIHSGCYSPSPLVIQGAGAGNEVTAAGVLADIFDLQDLFSIHGQHQRFTPQPI